MGDRLVVEDSGGARLGLLLPGARAAVAEGKPVVAVGELSAPCILLRGGDAIVVESGLVRLDGRDARVLGRSIRIGIGDVEQTLRATYERAGKGAIVHRGQVEPPLAGVVVAAIGSEGEPLGAGLSDERGGFSVVARPGEARLLVVLGEGRGSAVLPAQEGVRLALFPLGHVDVQVRDEATGRKLAARVFVHGEGATREPNFGPSFRASGAGSLIDAETGELALPLPAGQYRVLATHGPEWTIDERSIELRPGAHAAVELSLRHVVPTPGLAACDFHVHSSAGFDSDVTVEDRVRTLASVGVDFAIPSEHNRVGSYAVADALGLGADLGWAPGVEITTYAPLQGHFNVFPYPLAEPPPHQRTDLGKLVTFVRAEVPGAIVQVNHPRLGSGMGYFDQIGQDARTLRTKRKAEEGFDTLEVYNGFDLPHPGRVDALIGEWLALFDVGRRHWATGNSDSHTAQYLWAGFPRTYVALAGDHEDFFGPPVAVDDVVTALRHGHATATSGPLVDLWLGDRREAGPGDDLLVAADETEVLARVKVRAAPWIDVRRVEVLVRGRVAKRWDLPEVPARVGPEPGELRDLEARAVRLDETVRLPVGPAGGSVVVVARGERPFAEVLPFLEGVPFGFTNPVRVVRGEKVK